MKRTNAWYDKSFRRKMEAKGFTEEQIEFVLSMMHEECDYCEGETAWKGMGGNI